MKFNLDLAADALKAWRPRCLHARSTALDLDRVEVFSALSTPKAGALYVLAPDVYRSLPHEWANAGCAFVATGPLDRARRGMPALALEAPCTLHEAESALLDMRARLDAWSEDVLRAIAGGSPLQEVFDLVARAFKNPLMLSDSALLFVLTAGSLPEGFQDRFWTPAMETGLCPVERYSETWRRVSTDDYLRKHACLVEDRETGRHYIYRNLIAEDGMHGMFELVDVNAPFTSGDIALVEYVADLLALAVRRSTYRELSVLASDPLFSLTEGRPVSERALREGLQARGWEPREDYYVCFAVNSVDVSGPEIAENARLSQTANMTLLYPAPSMAGSAMVSSTERYEMGVHVRQQLERSFPHSCVFSLEEGCLMIVRERDFPLASMREKFHRKPLDPEDPVELLVGVSSPQADFRKLSVARAQAQFAMDLAESDHGGALERSRACFYDDVFFLDLARRMGADKDAGWLAPDSVARLAANDAAEGTEYAATLLAYLEHGCNINRTAEALFIHRNTLAYRIKRIRAISGIDLEHFDASGDEMLRVWLACRMLRENEK